MSWLSQAAHAVGGAVKKLTTGGGNGRDSLPPITIRTGVDLAAKRVGESVTEWMQRIGAGQPVGSAATATLGGQAADLGNKAQNVVTAATAGVQVAGAFDDLMKGPAPWLLIGLALAGLLGSGRRGK
jgi:hypothetical protein